MYEIKMREGIIMMNNEMMLEQNLASTVAEGIYQNIRNLPKLSNNPEATMDGVRSAFTWKCSGGVKMTNICL